MTTEEAIKALGLMKNVESIVATYEPGEIRNDTTVHELREACRIAADALRAQQQTEKNDPLTLEELRGMDGEPVYVVQTDSGKYARFAPEWCIIHTYGDDGSADIGGIDYDHYWFNEYERDWLAYRHKPEEETE